MVAKLLSGFHCLGSWWENFSTLEQADAKFRDGGLDRLGQMRLVQFGREKIK